jgi:hypothetical protein
MKSGPATIVMMVIVFVVSLVVVRTVNVIRPVNVISPVNVFAILAARIGQFVRQIWGRLLFWKYF